MSEPSSPDIVAELDRWLVRLRDDHLPDDPDYTMMQRARDEIVALRERVWLNDQRAMAAARADERERCARIADGYCTDRTDDVAAAIRDENIGFSEERTS